MSSVNSVNFENINRTETDVCSNGVGTGKLSFDEKKIKELQNSLSVNLTMLAKKRAVAYGSIFTSNMWDKTSFKTKVGQIFENIKLKFWNASKSISRDCKKLEKLLTEGVTASLVGGKSQTDVIGRLKDEISKFLGKEPLYGENSIEPLKSYPRNHARLSALKTRVEELHKFSEFADKLNNFHLPYEEENFNADDEQTQRNLSELLKQFYQTKNRFDAMFQSSSIKDEQLSSIKEAYDKKRQDIEDRICGKHIVVNFYNTLDLDDLTDDALVKKCASAVEKMKSAERLLNKAEDLLAKDSDIDSNKYQRFGEYFNSQWLPVEVSQKRSALEHRLSKIAHPEGTEEEAVQQNKEGDDDFDKDDFDYEAYYARNPFEGEDLIQTVKENQQEEAEYPEVEEEEVKEEPEEELPNEHYVRSFGRKEDEIEAEAIRQEKPGMVSEFANIPYIIEEISKDPEIPA